MLAHRFFFALKPSAPAMEEIGRLRDGCGPYQAIVPNPRLHATLAITPDYAATPRHLPDTMIAIGHSISAAPIMVTLDCLSETASSCALRPRRRNVGLVSLQQMLAGAMERAGLLRSGWRPGPHVTLGYRAMAPGTRAITPIRWLAGDFVLIHSIVGATRHIELGRWPLIPSQLSFDDFLSSTATGGTCGSTAPAIGGA